MRTLGALIAVLGLASLLFGCMLSLAAVGGGSSATFWGFGLIVVGLLMRLSAPRQAAPPTSYATHRRCPACAEPILREAVKCKHCGTAVEPDPLPPPVNVWREIGGEVKARLGPARKHDQAPPAPP